MGRQLTHAELEELLGAYAVDALEPDEVRSVEVHLRECPRCHAEVTELREAVTLLAFPGAPAPDRVWQAIEAELESAPPAPTLSALLARPRPGRRRAVQLAAGAAACVIASLGWLVHSQGRRLDQLSAALAVDGMRGVALAAQADPLSRQAELRTPEGRVVSRVVVRPDGTGFLLDALPTLERGRTYQVWAVVDGHRVSAGVTASGTDVTPFRIAVATWAVALTVEVSPGVTVPSAAPIAAGRLTA